jgi:hypothetical protein
MSTVFADDKVPTAVFGAYGGTMLAVQRFEFSLVGLVLAADIDMPRQRSVDDVIKDLWFMVQTWPASRLHKRLEGKIPDELNDEIETLIKWRNFLAHRYLRTRVLPALDRPRDHFLELARLALAFDRASSRVETMMLTLGARSDQPSPPAAVAEAVTEVTQQIIAWAPPIFQDLGTEIPEMD